MPGEGRIIGTTRGAYWKRKASGKWDKLSGPIQKLSVSALALDSSGGWIFAGTNDGIYRSRLERLDFKKPSGYRMIPRVSSLLISHASPGIVHATTHLGLLRSSNNGSTWEILSAGLPIHEGVESLAVDPSDPTHMFVGTRAGLHESHDAGTSWGRVKDDRLGVVIPSVIYMDSTGKRILAADNTRGGVFYSIDGGIEWQRIAAPEFMSPVHILANDPANPSFVYLGTQSEGIYRLYLPGAIP
jgi:photosystem II stability/assembly factor-like uncharacterized protein